MERRRVAILVSKTLSTGAAANVAALLMGQLVSVNRSIYGEEAVTGVDGSLHAAIRHSTVVLKAGGGQLISLAKRLVDISSIEYCCFSSLGQSLNDQYEDYARRIGIETVDLVGIAMFGPYAVVKDLTKSFSLLQ